MSADDNFHKVTRLYESLPYMREPQAMFLKKFIEEKCIRSILEIGFFKGKSSAYFGAILEDLGDGAVVTIDKRIAKTYSPNIEEVISSLNLTNRVKPIYAHRSHTWELGKMVRSIPRPQFDLCYFDGGHTWDVTGFGFVLVHMLLKPGGWIIFDDLDWTVRSSPHASSERGARLYKSFSEEEKSSPGVRLVFETLVPELGYINCGEEPNFKWGIAQKT